MSIFRKKPAPKIEDPVFGSITWERGIWAFIPKTEAEGFMISIEAPESGPSDLQREFFQQLRSALAKLQDQAIAFIKANPMGQVDVSRLYIYSIEVDTDEGCRHGKFVVELSDGEAHVIHRVSFEGGQPVNYGCDD